MSSGRLPVALTLGELSFSRPAACVLVELRAVDAPAGEPEGFAPLNAGEWRMRRRAVMACPWSEWLAVLFELKSWRSMYRAALDSFTAQGLVERRIAQCGVWALYGLTEKGRQVAAELAPLVPAPMARERFAEVTAATLAVVKGGPRAAGLQVYDAAKRAELAGAKV